MFCVQHEWPGDDALFLAQDYAEAERIELAIARDRASGDEYPDLSEDIRWRLASENFRTAFAAVDDFCTATDECLTIKTLGTYFDQPAPLTPPLSQRELATVLAALRLLAASNLDQAEQNDAYCDFRDMATDNGRFPLPTGEEVDSLCDRLEG